MRVCILFLTSLLLLVARASAITPQEAQTLYQRVAPSLVAVQYTLDGEFGRREFIGQGIVIKNDGTVMASLAMFPIQFPDEQMKDFKIIIPGDQEKEIEAVFLGRDERSDVAFLRAKEKRAWQPIEFENLELKVAEPVASIGLLPKEAGYKAYYAESAVAALLRGPVPLIMVNNSGLTSVGATVFNAAGKAVGYITYQQGQTMLLNPPGNTAMQLLATPPRFFVPARDFLPSLADLPTGEPLRLPWVGAILTGIPKEVSDFYKLQGVPVAQVGEIIPNSPASKAGLKTGDKILKLDGKELERGDEPDETSRILLRNVRRMKVGDKITLTIVRERDKPTIDLQIALEEQPKQANLAKRYYAEDLGMSVREVVFADTYAKKVAADTKGVVVAFVRQASSAQTAGLHINDLVTEINKTPVQDLDNFKMLYKGFREKNPKELIILVVIREQKTEVIKIEPPQ